MNSLFKPSILGSFVFAAALLGCVFDHDNTVAGGEDFPNTITPLGKVTAGNISSFSNWDQFQGIDTTPDLSTDSLTKTLITAKLAAAKLAVAMSASKDTTITVQQMGQDDVLTVHTVRFDGGVDGKLSTKADNVVEEYTVLRTRQVGGQTDTVEWTQLVDADNDGNLWGAGDSGVVELRRQVENPFGKPGVARMWSTLKAWINNKGKTSAPLSYTERCFLHNGDTTVFAAKGIRGVDSLMVPGDTSLVTFNRFPVGSDSLLESRARYWVRLGKLARPFLDNALLRFEVKNRRKSGVIRYDSIAFTPDSAVISGHIDIHGSFDVFAQDEKGTVTSQVVGSFRNDSIQVNMRETRDGKVKNYHMIYDGRGEIEKHDTLPDDEEPGQVLKPTRYDDMDSELVWKAGRK